MVKSLGKKPFLYLSAIVALGLLVLFEAVFPPFRILTTQAGSSDNVSGFAWSENIGWISFNNISGGGAVSYGVNIDPDTGDLSGYAWSENIGWFSFNRSDTGNPPAAPFNGGSGPIARYDKGNGEVKGWMRVLANAGGWDGWIKLNGFSGGGNFPIGFPIDFPLIFDGGVSYGVSIDANGDFHGWAWSDMVVGWISLAGATYGAQPNKPSLSYTTSYCIGLAGIGLNSFSWDYQDTDNDPQTYYQLQVERTSSPAGLLVDCQISQSVSSGQKGTSAVRIVSNPTSALCDLPSFVGDINYGASFRAKVRVKDTDGLWSIWSDWLTFSSQSHAYPFVDFSWSPQSPGVGEKTLFTDESVVYGGATISSWSWTFPDGSPATSAQKNPEVAFSKTGAKNITLTVTDSHGFTCSGSLDLILQLPYPAWKEISPW